MEQEGDEINAQILDYDRSVRSQVMLGCQHAKQLELKLIDTPSGSLEQIEYDNAQAIFASLISDAAAVVNTFSRVLSYLSSWHSLVEKARSSDENLSFGIRSSTWEQTHQSNVILQAGKSQETSFDGAKPSSSSLRQASGTPPISPRFKSTSELRGMLSPATGCPAARTSSQSPIFSPSSRMSPTPSPPLEAPDKISSQSTFNPPAFATASSMELAHPWVAQRVLSPDQAETGGSSDQQQYMSKRRRSSSLPTSVVTLPVSITEHGTDTLPADGYAWRKYGQKDIQNSRHPRSYYRCTYRKELGCLATKQVQRSDEDPSQLCVTYHGVHSCHMSMQMQQQRSWLSPDVAMPLPQWQTSISEPKSPKSSSMVNDRGGQIQPGTYPTFVTSSESFEDEPYIVPYITSSREGTFNQSWRYNPPSVTAPTAAMTPRFGTDPISIRELQSVNRLLDETDQSRPTKQHRASVMMSPSSADLKSGSDGYQPQTGWNNALGHETSAHTSAEYSTGYHSKSGLKEFLNHQTMSSWSTDSSIEPTQRAVNASQSNYGLQRTTVDELCAVVLPSLAQSISLTDSNDPVRKLTEASLELLEMPTRDRAEFTRVDQHHSNSFQTHFSTSGGELEQLCTEVEDQAAPSVLYHP